MMYLVYSGLLSPFDVQMLQSNSQFLMALVKDTLIFTIFEDRDGGALFDTGKMYGHMYV